MEKKTDKEYSVSGKLIGGCILIFIGLILLEDTLGINISDQIVPFVLIGLGIFLMVRRRNKEMKSKMEQHAESFQQKADDFEAKVNEKFQQTNSSIDEHLNKFDQKMAKFESKIDDIDKNIDENLQKAEQKFSSSNRDYSDPSHKNGKIKYERSFGDLYINCNGINAENIEVSSFFGDINIQMQHANYADSLNRLIISNFIGDVTIYIPKGLSFFTSCSNFIGDIETVGKKSTGFGNKLESHSPDYDSANRKLYIACNSFIGDIRIVEV